MNGNGNISITIAGSGGRLKGSSNARYLVVALIGVAALGLVYSFTSFGPRCPTTLKQANGGSLSPHGSGHSHPHPTTTHKSEGGKAVALPSAAPVVKENDMFSVHAVNTHSLAVVTLITEVPDDINAMKNLIGSVHFWHPELPIMVYGFKLGEKTVDLISTYQNTVLVNIKSDKLPSVLPIVQHALGSHECALFLDAHFVLSSRVDHIEERLHKMGYFYAADKLSSDATCRPEVFGFLRGSTQAMQGWEAVPFDTANPIIVIEPPKGAVPPPKPDTPCQALKKKYGIMPMVTWGSAPADAQKDWTQRNCDTELAVELPTPPPPKKKKTSVYAFARSVEVQGQCDPLTNYPLVLESAEIRSRDRVTLSTGAGQVVVFSQEAGRFELGSERTASSMFSAFAITHVPPPKPKGKEGEEGPESTESAAVLAGNAAAATVLQPGQLVALTLLKSSPIVVRSSKVVLEPDASKMPQLFLLVKSDSGDSSSSGSLSVALQLWSSRDESAQRLFLTVEDGVLKLALNPTVFTIRRAGGHYSDNIRTVSPTSALDEVVMSASVGHTHHHNEGRDSSRATKIALLVPTLSTKTTGVRMPFFSLFLPTLVKTIKSIDEQKELGGEQFEYIVYLGYDVGDKYYDTPQGEEEVAALFKKMTDGYPLSLKTSRHTGMKGAPCWLWNALGEQAFHENVDYMYQLNDDISFVTPGWTETFVGLLRSNQYHPNLGVTGPEDHGGRIFTQSFVSKLHLEIFPTYYPKVFKNWWSDDWISMVYAPNHSFKNKVIAKNTNVEETRYNVEWGADKQLPAEVEKGKKLIEDWLRRHADEEANPSAAKEEGHHGAKGRAH